MELLPLLTFVSFLGAHYLSDKVGLRVKLEFKKRKGVYLHHSLATLPLIFTFILQHSVFFSICLGVFLHDLWTELKKLLDRFKHVRSG
jgi:hypothetical protein